MYVCRTCNKLFVDDDEADKHDKTHDIRHVLLNRKWDEKKGDIKKKQSIWTKTADTVLLIGMGLVITVFIYGSFFMTK